MQIIGFGADSLFDFGVVTLVSGAEWITDLQRFRKETLLRNHGLESWKAHDKAFADSPP